MQGKARSRAYIVVPLHQSSLAVVISCYADPLPLRAKEMSTGTQLSSIDDITTFTARLDGLRVDQDPDDLSNALRAAFKEQELYSQYISSLMEDTERAKALLEIFDKVCSVKCAAPWIGSQRWCTAQALQATTCDVVTLKRVRQFCGWTGFLPTSHTIPEGLIRTTEDPVAGGGFSDVWEGIYDDKRVAIKALRVYKGDDIRKVRKVSHPAFPIPILPVDCHHQVFCKEVVIWRRISHPNIVPFLGVSEAPTPFCIVSEWMPNGDVRIYVRKNPAVSRLQLVRRPESALGSN